MTNEKFKNHTTKLNPAKDTVIELYIDNN